MGDGDAVAAHRYIDSRLAEFCEGHAQVLRVYAGNGNGTAAKRASDKKSTSLDAIAHRSVIVYRVE
jgi:hypothetical protein